ncbi:MAG: hypothetical protein Q4G35_04725 [Propionibacteriaceae bacterium]|nr:hypothetical protein [Propionibacteriaceae bacterium]
MAIVLAVLFAFVGGGIATWWGITANRGGDTEPETPVVSWGPVEPSDTAEPAVDPEPAAEPTPAQTTPSFDIAAAVSLAETSGLRCHFEGHRFISSYWCAGDGGQVRLYLGGDLDGTLQHASVTNRGNWDPYLSEDLARAVGGLLMPEAEYNADLVLSHFAGDRQADLETQMGGRQVRVRQYEYVIITTPGWAVGLDQPTLHPFTDANRETLVSYGFECYADQWLNCTANTDGAYYSAGGSNDGNIWTFASPEFDQLPSNATIELQSLAWALTGRDDALYTPIFKLEPGTVKLVDGLWMTHLSYEAGGTPMQEISIELSCWAAARTDC